MLSAVVWLLLFALAVLVGWLVTRPDTPPEAEELPWSSAQEDIDLNFPLEDDE